MAAYMLFIREAPVHDPVEMAEYQRLNRESAAATSARHSMKPLVVYGATEAVEGPAPDGVLILEFPTVEDARAWYESPAYQEALPHRMKAADYRAMIVQGL